MATKIQSFIFPSGELRSPFEVMLVKFGLKDMGLKQWQEDLAIASPVFRRLLHQGGVLYPGDDELQPLAGLWEVAGSPPDKTPKAWMESGDWSEYGPIEDRGEQGVWANFVVAAWYAEDLCDLIDPGDICYMCH